VAWVNPRARAMRCCKRISLGLFALAVMALAAAPLRAADPRAGQALFQGSCVPCHVVADWKGKSGPQVAQAVTDVNSGKHEHPRKLGLSDAQVADLAAWLSTAGTR